jgi:hypothetical protein
MKAILRACVTVPNHTQAKLLDAFEQHWPFFMTVAMFHPRILHWIAPTRWVIIVST